MHFNSSEESTSSSKKSVSHAARLLPQNKLTLCAAEFLSFREQMPILKDNKEKYTSRLVAKFLLAFWKPVA
jgi:hypothetical protein